jgi:hypothetical protein
MITLPPVDQIIQDIVVAAVSTILGFFFGHKRGKKSEREKNGD